MGRRDLDLFSAVVKRHNGRVMHYAGDAVLAKFDAVVDALTCATEIHVISAAATRSCRPIAASHSASASFVVQDVARQPFLERAGIADR